MITFPLAASAQRWTAEEQAVLNFSTGCWEAWEEAVNKKSHKIWLDACLLSDDWKAWWTSDGALWTLESEKRNFDYWVQNINHFQLENIQPLDIRVYDDVALIWFYAIYSQDDAAGTRTRYEDKRFEVTRKIDGRWRWTGGMISAREVGNFVEK